MLEVHIERDVENPILSLRTVPIYDDEHIDVGFRLTSSRGLGPKSFASSKFFPRADRKLCKNSSSAAASLDFTFTRLVMFYLLLDSQSRENQPVPFLPPHVERALRL